MSHQHTQCGIISKRRDASRHLARVQELGDRGDDQLRSIYIHTEGLVTIAVVGVNASAPRNGC